MSSEACWMNEAFIMAEEALKEKEVPVGCVFVKEEKIIARGRNRVNETKNATKHAEIVAIDQLKENIRKNCRLCIKNSSDTCSDDNQETDNSKKECNCEEIFIESVSGCTVYVTCEPCIMCAAALRMCRISNVVFGCCNDRFGGNGSVLSVHNGHSKLLQTYEVKSGVQADRAMSLLVQFYKSENKNAPEHKRKVKVS